ncbi:Cathepsin, V-Cath [Perigonia lusca single nucleopolyhedrovirus]|uniref:Viral cathepsin n=1 Tax=Perigonia lusca single nucleopolyhedrovirus TaxID=1675865 RepID=A0A0M3WNJ0_9ABAC|nr:Cathepsin, V-Cath [Perigonia lusca single nucleopolyhedrovirus]AKN80580.1 Cathepsin, V-Cath [Perigonia lusca single nucleopolyhedrovirus]
MKPSVLIVVATLAALLITKTTAKTTISLDNYDLLKAPDYFDNFVANYNKMYNNTSERNYRYKIFKHNLEEINQKNKLNTTAVYSINKFSDMSKNEIISKYTGLSVPQNVQNFCKVIALDGPPGKGPLDFDWRQYNKITFVKNQGACGACWAFSTLASVESQYAIKYNKHIDLSEQQLIDCDYVDLGCNGGLLHTAFEQMIEMNGVHHEKDYPYRAFNGASCNMNIIKDRVKVLGCYRYILNNEEKIKDLLRAVGPIPIAIDAANIVEYSRGIINFCEDHGLNHAVLLVGYGVENNVPFWTFKNSWGDDWGEAGYFRVRQNINACGMINNLASTAVIE